MWLLEPLSNIIPIKIRIVEPCCSFFSFVSLQSLVVVYLVKVDGLTENNMTKGCLDHQDIWQINDK